MRTNLLLFLYVLEYDPNADKIHMMIKNIINNFKNPFQSPVFMAVPPKIQKKIITKNNIMKLSF